MQHFINNKRVSWDKWVREPTGIFKALYGGYSVEEVWVNHERIGAFKDVLETKGRLWFLITLGVVV